MLAVLAFVACGGDSKPAAAVEAPTTVPPAATQVVVEVTVAPVPTETPVPTAKPDPTSKPPAELTKNFGSEVLAASKAQPMVDFPVEITKGSPILEKDQVLAYWTEFLEGTRTFAFSDSLIWELCPGGEGTWVYELGSPNFTGAKFDYELQNDPGGSWNSVVLVYKLRDKTLFDLMGGAGNRVGFQGIKVGEPSNIHEALTCS